MGFPCSCGREHSHDGGWCCQQHSIGCPAGFLFWRPVLAAASGGLDGKGHFRSRKTVTEMVSGNTQRLDCCRRDSSSWNPVAQCWNFTAGAVALLSGFFLAVVCRAYILVLSDFSGSLSGNREQESLSCITGGGFTACPKAAFVAGGTGNADALRRRGDKGVCGNGCREHIRWRNCTAVLFIFGWCSAGIFL